MSPVLKYGSIERIFSLQALFFPPLLLWVLAERCAYINYLVKAHLRGTNLNPGLFVTMFAHCRGTAGKCSFPVKALVR